MRSAWRLGSARSFRNTVCILVVLALGFLNGASGAVAKPSPRPERAWKISPSRPSPHPALTAREQGSVSRYPDARPAERPTSRRSQRTLAQEEVRPLSIQCMGAYDWYWNYRLWYCPYGMGQRLPDPVPPGKLAAFTVVYSDDMYTTRGGKGVETIKVSGPCGTIYQAGDGTYWMYTEEAWGSAFSGVEWRMTIPQDACLGWYTYHVTVSDPATGRFVEDETYFYVGYAVPNVPQEQTFGCGNETGTVDPSVSRGDPVNTATGAACETVTDLQLPGRGTRFSMTRSYTSNDTTDGPLGAGWTHPYESSLVVAPNGDAVLRAEDGQRIKYVKQSGGGFVGSAGARSTLSATASGYTLTTPKGHTRTYDSSGRLLSMKAENGHGVSLAGGGRVETLTTAEGANVTFTYREDGKLQRVAVPDGRDVEYGYTDGRLTTVTDAGGGVTTYGYDEGGRLSSILDPLGHYSVRYTYGANGRVVSQLDALGRETTFSWDAATGTSTTTDPRGATWKDVYVRNVLSETVDPLGNVTKFYYDDRLNLIQMTDPRGHSVNMTYDGAGNMLSRKVGSLGYTQTFSYDWQNRPLSATDGRGGVTTYAYDAEGRLSTETNPLGGVTTYTYTSGGQVATITNPNGKVTSFTYDANGSRTSMTRPSGAKTTWAYDASGRVASVVEPRGNVAGANPDEFRTSYEYDATDHLLSTTDPRGNRRRFVYDAAGRVEKMIDPLLGETLNVYDDANRLVQVTEPGGAITKTGYDSVGNVTSVETPAGKTTFEYDLAGRVVSRTDPRGNAPGGVPAEHTWTFTYDAAGNVKSATDPLGKTSTFTYDAANRRRTVADAIGRTTTYAYDANSNVTSITDAAGGVRTFAFDAANRMTSSTDVRGKTSLFAYDAGGNLLSATTPLGNKTTWTYDADGLPITMVEARGNVSRGTPSAYTTTYGYDAAQNLTSVRNPLGHVTARAYDRAGNLVRITDPKNRNSTFEYDALERLKSVTATDGAVTTYTYDGAGDLTTRTDAKGHVTTYGYDAAHRLTSIVNPLGRRWTFEYDAAGNVTRTVTPRVDAAGQAHAITGTYDPLGRLTARSYSDGTPGVSFTYDAVGNRKSMIDGSGTTTYDYDALDRPTRVAKGSGAFTYGYDAAGNVTSRTYPDGTAVTSTFDNDNRLATIVANGGTTGFTYDAAGHLTSMSLPSGNGHAENRTWDAAGRLTQVANMKGTKVLSQFGVTLDATGNPTSATITRARTTTSEAYTYDAADRISKVCFGVASCTTSSASIAYTYDKVGNRISEVRTGVASPGTRTSVYDDADQILSSTFGTATTTYDHDAAGNMTRMGSRTYAYDLDNRMTQTAAGTTTTAYSYDGDGRRATRSTNGSIDTRYSWDANLELPQIALERTAAGTLARRFVNRPSGPISMTTASGETVYFHHDVFNNVSDVTNAAGSPTYEYAYEPFGTIRTEKKIVSTAPVNPIGFAGQYLDSETGQYHMRARQYDPTLGRFLAVDPLRPNITDPYVSSYVYANDRPGVLIDPTGLSSSLGSDLWAATKGAAKGVCKFLTGDCSFSLEGDLLHPIGSPLGPNPVGDFLSGVYNECKAGFDQYSSNFDGFLKCVDNINPVAGVRDKWALAWELGKAGCVEESAELFVQGNLEAVAMGSVFAKAIAARAGIPLAEAERVGSGLLGDKYHRAASFVIGDSAASRFTIIGGDNVRRTLYQLLGEVDGKPGVFEWISQPGPGGNVITHQRFIPGGRITGYPNQKP